MKLLKVRITYTVTKQMEIKLYTRVTITAGPKFAKVKSLQVTSEVTNLT